MSDTQQLQGFGFQDDTDKSLQSKAGGKFGLNLGFITKFEYNPNAGKDGTPGDAFDITVTVGEREFRSRVYGITKIFGKDSAEITDKTNPEYITKFNEAMTQMKAMFTHFLKVFRTPEEIKAAFATPPASFADYFKLIASLKPDNFNTIPVDVFLEYQWNIQGENTRTFLQLPKNMKGGYFICKAVPANGGVWIEDREGGKLVYKDAVGTEHPFDRSQNYMESKKAIQQIEGEDTAGTSAGQGSFAAPQANAGAKPATWGS